jgi:branched-chain amino acid transport system substrate-binding protein
MNKNIKITVGAIILVLIFVGMVYYRQKPGKADSIEIGSILILSGQGASWGEAARNGINLAVNEINSRGGILGKRLAVNYQDDGGDPTKSVSAFRELTAVNKIKYIIGTSWSVTGLPLVNLAKEKKVVMISPSLGVKEFNEANDYLFNTWPHDYILSQNLAEYVYQQGKRHAALLGANDDPWVVAQTNAFKSKFEELGGKVDLVFQPLTTDKDVKTYAIQVKNNGLIDAVVMTTDGYDLTDFYAKALYQFSVQKPIYSITLDNQIINNCGQACEGLMFLTFLTPTSEFQTKYKNLYNQKVGISADSAYDAVMMLAQAMTDAKSTDPDIVKNYLANIQTYSGASGNLTSDGKRGFTKDYKTMIIKNGVPVEAQP